MSLLQRSKCAVFGVAILTGAMPATVPARSLPATLDLGREQTGQPCIATRGWQVGQKSTFFEQDQGYSITCRGAAAARVQGYVSVPSAHAAPTPNSACGGAKTLTIARIGPVEARRCFDPKLRQTAIDLRVTRGKGVYQAAAVQTALAPLEALLRVVILGERAPNRDDRTTPSLNYAELAAAPLATDNADAGGGAGFTAQIAITRGLQLIHSGRRVEASRLLNDATSEFVDAPPQVQAELRMTTGLADSNISEFEAAAAHFTAAGDLINASPASETTTTLKLKRAAYMALDATNRRAWNEALVDLDRAPASGYPLTDPVTLGLLNQEPENTDPAAAIGVSSVAQLDRLVLDAEISWTRSLSNLGLGRIGPSRTALERAARSVRVLQASRVQPSSIAWLRAGIERQRGRIDEAAHEPARALASYNCAIATMQNSVPPAGSACLFTGPAGRVGEATASPTIIAETQLERAKVASTIPGTDRAKLLADYDGAVDILAASGGTSGAAPLALAGYLDTLIGMRAANASPGIDERFFKALQATGEPAVAREVVRLQSVVSDDAGTQALLADQAENERRVLRLRYEIQNVAPGDAATLKALQDEQNAANAALNDVNARMPPAMNSVVESSVTIGELRELLKPGEVYLKLAALNGSVYAAAISGDKTFIYRVEKPADWVNATSTQVLKSARSFVDASGQVNLRAFAYAKSRDLFAAVAGPAQAMLTAATSISYDPVGELRNLPASIFVTDLPVSTPASKLDYTQIAFLGRKVDLATALSPRSFVVTRTKVARAAPKLFLGLGETAYAAVPQGAAADRTIQLAPGCDVAYGTWVAAYNSNTPISAREIGLSAAALQVGTPTMITGAAFTDANVKRASDAGELAQYQVLHFATHGLTAQPFPVPGCKGGLPPSLLTTLLPETGGAVPSTGLLSYDQIAGLRLNANLVFLSACETASGLDELAGRLTGQEESTPSLDGLVRAFFAAKARTVVATLWSVPATADTDSLIETFYRSGRNASIESSLRTAQLTLMNKPATSHPYFWAAYFVVGDGSGKMLDRSQSADAAPAGTGGAAR